MGDKWQIKAMTGVHQVINERSTVKPLIAATFAAMTKWPLFRGGRYSEVQQKFKPKHLTRFIGVFVVLMAIMRQYPRESEKNN